MAMQKLDVLLSQAMAQLESNPNIANNPMAQGALDALKSGDPQKGEEMANNLCESMGISRDDALKQAKQFFGIPM